MQHTKPIQLLGIGRVVMDHVVQLPAYPECDTKCVIQKHYRQVGGPVPVALSTANHFGVPATFLGAWGDDPAGYEIRDVLRGRGIRIEACSTNASTGFAHVWTDAPTGRRTIAAFPGGELDRRDLSLYLSLAERCCILHLDGSSGDVAVAMAAKVKQAGGIVVLDAGSKKVATAELLPMTDVLIASDLFCRSWFERGDVTLGELLNLGVAAVVRTLGEHGAAYGDGHREFQVPGIPVDAVDTNGAGDIFSGAWLTGITRGWDPMRCLTFANEVAAHSCRFHGNQTLPDISLTNE